MLDMEVPGLAHNISSPLSPCEGMIKDLSLDAIQLCERDGEAASFSLSRWQPGSDRLPPSFTLIVWWKQVFGRALDEMDAGGQAGACAE